MSNQIEITSRIETYFSNHPDAKCEFHKYCGNRGGIQYSVLQYRMTGHDKTVISVSNACRQCTRQLTDRDERFVSKEYWDALLKNGEFPQSRYDCYVRCGLINDFGL